MITYYEFSFQLLHLNTVKLSRNDFLHYIRVYMFCYVVDIPVNTTGAVVKEILEGLRGIGSVSVGGSYSCYRFTWYVDFVSNPGRQPLITIKDNFVTGAKPNIYTYKQTDGHYKFNPLPGDMLSTVHTIPQVHLYNISPYFKDVGYIERLYLFLRNYNTIVIYIII